eukprot:gene6929-12544_t
MRKQKPFKIQDAGTKMGRIGMTASSLKELREKVANKFEIDADFRLVLEADGTEIEDESYFSTLPEQTVLVVLRPGQFWDGYITYLKLATKKIQESILSEQENVINLTQEMLQDPESPYMLEILNFIKNLKVDVDGENIEEDPDWFEGVPGKLKTKEAVLRRSAIQRVRSYFNHSKDFIDKSKDVSPKGRKELLFILAEFRRKLQSKKYYEEYFARSSESELKFCNKLGWFECEGQYNKENCTGSHKINPYSSRDARILFKTWNLDHRIEKSREILPKLIKATEECPEEKTVNLEYFYDLLFTRVNLRLVDVRCHVIAAHDECKIDERRQYRKRKLK